jgi:hypothetical protein
LEEEMIKIATEKVVVPAIAGRARRVLRVEALRREELPKEYLEGPHCYLDAEGNLCMGNVREVWGASFRESTKMTMGGMYPEGEFQGFLEFIWKCGQRLAEINRANLRLAREWQGEETFVI